MTLNATPQERPPPTVETVLKSTVQGTARVPSVV